MKVISEYLTAVEAERGRTSDEALEQWRSFLAQFGINFEQVAHDDLVYFIEDTRPDFSFAPSPVKSSHWRA